MTLAGGAIGRAHRARRRLDRLRRGARPARRRRRASAAWTSPARVANVNGEIAPALPDMDAADQAAVDARADRARRHAGQAPARRQRHGRGVDGRRPCRRRGARRAALAAISPASGASRCPCRRSRSSAAARMPAARVDMQDFMVVCPARGSFAEALDWTAEVYRAAGARLAKRGTLHGVADEGGYWPDFESNEEALAELVRRDRATPASSPASDVGDRARHRRHRSSTAAAATAWRSRAASSTADGMLACCSALDRRAIRSSRSRIRSPRTTRPACARFTAPSATGVQIVGDDFSRHRCGARPRPPPRGACNAVLIKPNQVGTLTEANAALDAARAAGSAPSSRRARARPRT